MRLLIIFFPLFPFIVIANDSARGKVVKVADGDTVTILTDSHRPVKVRLAGIDCPERGQPWGHNATEALKALLAGQTVEVEVIDVDRYGRTVGRVYGNGVNVNRRLVESGDCWVYPRYAKDQELFRLQNEAQEAKRGLWQLPENERVSPWVWRKDKRK